MEDKINFLIHSKRSNDTMTISKRNRLFTWKTLASICIINASFGMFAVGSNVGWTSNAMDELNHLFTVQQKSRIFSAVALAAAIVPLLIHRIWHLIGTKRLILVSNFLMIVAWMLAILSKNNYWILLFSRAIGGCAVGTLHFLIPLYINDIAAVHQKPLYQSIMQLQFVFGILSQYVLRLCESFLIINLLPAIMSTVLFITFLFMPESPRYLSVRGDAAVAKDILVKFKIADRDMDNDLQLWANEHPKDKGFLSAFKEDFGVRYVIPVFGLFIFEQLIGAISILFYMQKILRLTDGEFEPEIAAILCGGVFAVSILLQYFLSIGNSSTIKANLMWSTNLMALILGLLGAYCHFQGSFGIVYTEDYRHVPLICLAFFYFFFANGPYRLSNEYAEQIIPKKCYFTVRCLLTAISWILIYVITRMLPQLVDNIGVGWLFWFMATMCLFMSVFVKLFVPDLNKLPEEFRLMVDNSSESNSEA